MISNQLAPLSISLQILEYEHEVHPLSRDLNCIGQRMVETVPARVPTCQETQYNPRPAINFLPFRASHAAGGLTGSGGVLNRPSGRKAVH